MASLCSSVELSEEPVDSELYDQRTVLRRSDIASIKRASPQQARVHGLGIRASRSERQCGHTNISAHYGGLLRPAPKPTRQNA
jgi:hypothetical protein